MSNRSGGRLSTTDRYSAYGFVEPRKRQICHARLQHEFCGMAQRDGPIGPVGKQLESLSHKFQREWAKVRRRELKRDDFVIWMRSYVRPRWESLLNRSNLPGKKAPLVVRWLLHDGNFELSWTLLGHEGLEPTNNGAERALRGAVTHHNLSWGSQSEEALRLIERLVCSTTSPRPS